MATNRFKPVSMDDWAAQNGVQQPTITQTAPPAVVPEQKPGVLGFIKGVANKVLKEGMNPLEATGYETIERNITPYSEDKSFRQKVKEDVISLGAGLPIALSHPIDTVKQTFYGGEKGDSFKERVMKGGLVSSFTDMFDKQYYEEHPALATLNTGSNVAALFSAGLSKAAGSVLRVGAQKGVQRAALSAGEHAAVKTALVSVEKSAVIKQAMKTAVNSGDTAFLNEAMTNSLIKKGVSQETAVRASGYITSEIQAGMAEKAGTLKVLKAGAQPLKTAGEAVKPLVDPIRKAIFGEAPNTAVGRIYSPEMVKANPEGFLDIERWAAQQVEERGLKNTIENRQAVMNEWSQTVPDWSVKTPNERVAYHQNYIKASEMSQNISKLTGDALVPTKALPESYIDAMRQTIKEASDTQSTQGILKELQDLYGTELSLHKAALEDLVAKNPTREALIEGIEALGRGDDFLYPNDAYASGLAKDLEDATGYRLGKAPSDKVISYAKAGATPESTALGVPTADKLTARTKLGQLVDRLGLSATGGLEGNLEHLYQDNFTQAVKNKLEAKFGSTVKVGNKTIPLDKLYSYLDLQRQNITDTAAGGFVPGKYTIFDMSANDMIRAGIPEAFAKDLAKIAKTALTDVPWQQTSLAEGLANIARARIPGYNKFLKAAFHGRFNINPAYGLQFWFEQEINKALTLKDPRAIGRAFTFGERVDNRLRRTLGNVPFLKDVIAPELSLSEIKLVNDEILSTTNRGGLDWASNPELHQFEKYSIAGGDLEEAARFKKSLQSKNVLNRGLGYNTAQSATDFARTLAERYGYTLQEAIGYRMENGKKVYLNPEMKNTITQAIESVYNYENGSFLTSPLAKTMNVVWFPFRFQAKTTKFVSKWLSDLSPTSRAAVVSNWNHFAKWSQTDEGKEWRKKNSGIWLNFLNYALPYESIGKGIGDVLDGKPFGGNVGQLGGMPFGFVTKIMKDLAILPDDPESRSPTTGKKYQKFTPKKLLSSASASVVLEDFITHMMPAIPFYGLTDGNMPSVLKDFAEKGSRTVVGLLESALTGKPTKGARSRVDRQFKRIQLDDTRFNQ